MREKKRNLHIKYDMKTWRRQYAGVHCDSSKLTGIAWKVVSTNGLVHYLEDRERTKERGREKERGGKERG